MQCVPDKHILLPTYSKILCFILFIVFLSRSLVSRCSTRTHWCRHIECWRCCCRRLAQNCAFFFLCNALFSTPWISTWLCASLSAFRHAEHYICITWWVQMQFGWLRSYAPRVLRKPSPEKQKKEMKKAVREQTLVFLFLLSTESDWIFTCVSGSRISSPGICFQRMEKKSVWMKSENRFTHSHCRRVFYVLNCRKKEKNTFAVTFTANKKRRDGELMAFPRAFHTHDGSDIIFSVFASVEFTSGLMQAANMNAISVYVHKYSICTMLTSLVAAVFSVQTQMHVIGTYSYVCLPRCIPHTRLALLLDAVGLSCACTKWIARCIRTIANGHIMGEWEAETLPLHYFLHTYVCRQTRTMDTTTVSTVYSFMHSFTDERSYGCTWRYENENIVQVSHMKISLLLFNGETLDTLKATQKSHHIFYEFENFAKNLFVSWSAIR